MIEKIKGIAIEGRCFSARTELDFFPGEKDRIALVYGKNGSGKSTTTTGIQTLISDKPTEDLSVELLDREGHPVTSLEYKKHIFVFNEAYIEENIKIDDGGLGAIVLLGEQVDRQAEIEEHIKIRDQKKREWVDVEGKLDDCKNSSNSDSSLYYWDAMVNTLKEEAGWVGRNRSIGLNSPVRATTVDKIGKREPTGSLMQLHKDFEEKKDLLDKVSRTSVPYPSLMVREISIGPGLEEYLSFLLSKEIQEPKLTDREKLILQTIQGYAEVFSERVEPLSYGDSEGLCPYCYQPITREYREKLAEEIQRVINWEARQHISELQRVTFPAFEEEYALYEDLAPELIPQIYKVRRQCRRLIEEYKGCIKQKTGNAYVPVFCEIKGLAGCVAQLNLLLRELQEKIDQFNDAMTGRKKLIEKLDELNRDIAHYEIRQFYKEYLVRKEREEGLKGEKNKLWEAYEKEAAIVKELQAKQSDIGLAIREINKALSYVFFSDNRLSIELRDKKYYLKSRGKDVLPKNVSIGERNIIALCYFFTQIMANQDVSKAYEKEVLVVVDDPVSSFDFENRVGILSYMNYQMDRLVRSNTHNKMLIFTHDLTTMHDLMASASDIVKILKAQDQKQDWKTSFRELRDRKLEDAFQAKKNKNLNEYSKMLMGIYNYAIGEAPEDYAMGNVMRRVLEAFATFNYRTGIAYVTRNQEVLQELDKAKKGYGEYFGNFIYRIVLHGESHTEDQVNHFHDDLSFYHYVSEGEKRKTAKDILCFMYLLNPLHVGANLKDNGEADNTERNKRIAEIQKWIHDIETKFTLS